MKPVQVYHADCVKLLPTMKWDSFDACVTDPPYHLESRVKRFGSLTAAPAQYGRDGFFQRASKGFMGAEWDGGDVAFQPETWEAVLTALKPGGHLLCFGGSRTFHRVAVAIEDAGFEIRDTIMWVYGTGVPKSHPVGEGLGTALKPAFEPIIMARRPVKSSARANVGLFGTGGLRIDDCRVPMIGGSPSAARRIAARTHGTAPGRPGEYRHTIEDRTTPERYGEARAGEEIGNWPANLIHDGSPEVEEALEVSGVPANGKPRSRFFYCVKANGADRAGSDHPTVKPIALLRYLIRLVTPPGGVVLDPFAGSGTTGQAAIEEGMRAVLIEREEQFVRDILRRFSRPQAA